jgi:peroxidase
MPSSPPSVTAAPWGGVNPTGEEAADGMAQLVVGSPGKDTLTGGDLNDTLVAARGHMTMTGGDGADTFVFNLDYLKGKHNTATITDFRKWTSSNF